MLSGRTEPDPSRIFAGLDLARRHAVIAAVSGGSDSLALLFLLHRHLQRIPPAPGLVAVTVDHGLRPEAADEARAVAAVCARHGIEHRTLRWTEDKPVAGISAAARAARYRLLAEAAREARTDLVLTGHTADDQAETVLMRQSRGDGRGLAGMAPATLHDGRLWIARPLLGTSRDALRDFLHSRGFTWIDDPTNLKPEYERARARREIASASDPEAMRQSLLDLSRRHAAERIAAGERAADVIIGMAQFVAPCLLRLPPDFGSAGTDRLYALRILLACAGGAEHLPDEQRTAGLMQRLRSHPLRATLSGAVIDARSSGIFIHREFRGAGPAAAAARDGMLWDRRYRVRDAGSQPGLCVAPLGRAAAADADVAADGVPAGLLRAALATQPAASRGEGPSGLLGSKNGPHGLAAVPILAPWADFLPSFDLAAAHAMASLLRADPIPEPPFAGHNRP